MIQLFLVFLKRVILKRENNTHANILVSTLICQVSCDDMYDEIVDYQCNLTFALK